MVTLAPCGTQAAYQRHRRHGEPPCAACTAANAAGTAARKKPLPPMARHGYPGGVKAHWRRGETPCDACRTVKSSYDIRYQKQTSAQRAARRAGNAPVRLEQPLPGWQNRAACRPGSGHDPDLWWPAGFTGRYRAQVRKAVTVCETCPVWRLCRADILLDERDAPTCDREQSIRGGLTPAQRARTWRRLTNTAAPVVA